MSDPYSFGGYDPNQTTEYDPTAAADFYPDPTQDYPYPSQPTYPNAPTPPPARYNPIGDQPTIQQAPTRVPTRVPARGPVKAQSWTRPARVSRTRVAPDRRDRLARASLWLGVLSAAVSLIPVCGIVALFPAAMGIVCGWLGRHSRRRGMALAGMLLSMLAIAAALAIAV